MRYINIHFVLAFTHIATFLTAVVKFNPPVDPVYLSRMRQPVLEGDTSPRR